MKALSLRPQWAMKVLLGEKSVECRSWKISYRGDLLICSSAIKQPGTISGHALCVVTLEDIVPFEQEHMPFACLDGYDFPKGHYAWKLGNLRWVKPFANKGKLSLYEVDDEKIVELSHGSTLDGDVFKRLFEPLVYWGRSETQALLG